ncbi:MAG: transcription antitermination factor NusB [Paracoccus sp. (in: a-proteobacteria)]|nr:transcription antitermination factor NusB [Paracoccus sp. (in: a-proteobacteria)]
MSTDDKGRSARQARSIAARLYAVQALFQMEAGGQSADRVGAEFRHWRIGETIEGAEMPEADVDLFERILGDVVTWQARIDQMTDRALVAKWKIDRIDPVLRALFRAAGAELVGGKTPPRVVIKEYVRLSDDFAAEERETRFVNAVLDHMAHEARPEEMGAK